jgi:hypothetical protein
MSCYKVVETEPLVMEDAIGVCAVDDANLLELYSTEEMMTFLYKVLDNIWTYLLFVYLKNPVGFTHFNVY